MDSVKIVVLRDGLDARAVRWGDDITTYVSYLVPVWARPAAVEHLARSLRAVEGDVATVYLECGQAVLVALHCARRVPRARPRVRVDPVRVAVTLVVLPVVASLLAVQQPWAPTRTSVAPPAAPVVIGPTADVGDAPVPAPPPGRPIRDVRPPVTGDPSPGHGTDLLPGVPMPWRPPSTVVRHAPTEVPPVPSPPYTTPPRPPMPAPGGEGTGQPGVWPGREPGWTPWLSPPSTQPQPRSAL